MNKNYQIIYVTNNAMFYFNEYVIRVLIPDVVYFHNLFIGLAVGFYRQLPLCSYLCSGYKM